MFLFVLLGSNQLQPILNSLFAALAASLTAYSRCRLRHEVPRTSREYALLTPSAATGLIQVVFFILFALLVRAQQGEPTKSTSLRGVLFVIQAAGLVYHRAPACILSPKAYLITEGALLLRLDDIQHFVSMIYNSFGIDDIHA